MLIEIMPLVSSVAAGFYTAVWLLLIFLSHRALSRARRLTFFSNKASSAKVSVIVPVRNEEKTIHRCIESLLRQKGFIKEIIVVDDNSTDSTWEVVKSYSKHGVKTIKAGAVPDGWVGKTWACNVGYLNSTGEWLLFTDADSEFSEGVIAGALHVAEEKEADLVTLYPRFRFNSFLHKAAMPILLMGLYLLVKPYRVESGGSAFAFGSFILLKRDAYKMLGGHAAVRDALLEDRAIALRALKAGLRAVFINATGQFSSTWNEDSKSLWNGMLRIFIPLFLTRPLKKALQYFPLALACIGIPLGIFFTGNFFAGSLCYLTVSAALGYEVRNHGARFWYGFMWPIGALAISAALFIAFLKSITEPSVTWKNRKYLISMGELHEKVVTVC